MRSGKNVSAKKFCRCCRALDVSRVEIIEIREIFGIGMKPVSVFGVVAGAEWVGWMFG